MKRALLAGLVAFCFCVCAQSMAPIVHAAIVSRDWKTPGDGLLTYDEVNKREWLDLTASRLSGFAGTSLEQRYQNAISMLGPGGLFTGFFPARIEDLTALAMSAGVDVSTKSYAINATAMTNLISAVGVSSSTSWSALSSFGLLDEFGPLAPTNQPFRKIGGLRVHPTSGPTGQAELWSAPGTANGLATPERTGVWLYRPVPEPTSLLLGIVGLLVLRGVLS